MKENKDPKMVEGYIVPNISKRNRAIRGTISIVAGLTTSIIAAYAGGQAASYSPETSSFISSLASKMGHGITSTISDIKQVSAIILENPSLLTSISQDSVSREVIDAGSKLVQYLQNDANNAMGNFVRHPIETTISSFGLAGGIKGMGNLLTKTLTHQDIPDINQRLRSSMANYFRKEDTSRKIEIPKVGGNIFTRK